MDYITQLFAQNRCVYCKLDLEKRLWRSCWDNKHHYKILPCSCGKKNWLTVHFHGSGHDKALTQKISPLESTIRKVREA
ncbi:TPA: hypothetical protein HA242_03120 [Candidatus Woesearchaeota archaeon]|nr:hypothetical protein [Candidatus Woesearchaeota archaeon]HIG92955.1 hypothetical protein [Candidatus Woesearchaeota archaeon]HIH12688.1 hypothetical protein [Candidatus Woesearchaeota archaeon]